MEEEQPINTNTWVERLRFSDVWELVPQETLCTCECIALHIKL